MYISTLFPVSRHSVHVVFVPCEQAQCKSCLFPCQQAQAEWCKSLQSGVRSSLSHTGGVVLCCKSKHSPVAGYTLGTVT